MVFTGHELDFVVKLVLSLTCGGLLGMERESRGKDAGISTTSLVIGGAMLFTFLSTLAGPLDDNTKLAAPIVSGIGFLGAGIIMKAENGVVRNLTTAASIWFAASIGMTIGFGWYPIAIMATIYALIIMRIPRISKLREMRATMPRSGKTKRNRPA